MQELTAKSSGKPFKKFNVRDEKGIVTNDVVAFPFFTQYQSIAASATVEAVLKESEFNGRKSFSLVDGNLGPKPSSFNGGAKNMEVKANNIAKAQDRKEDGIMISSTARMATEAVGAIYASLTPEDYKKHWLEWRKWFMENWESVGGPAKVSGTDIDYPRDINPADIPF